MKITGYSLISAAVVLATAALSITPAMAATKVQVPFNFVASGKAFPAGEYSVSLDKFSNLIRVQGYRNGLSAIGNSTDPAPNGKNTVLKFDQIGETYLLRTVQYGDQISPQLDKKAKQLDAAQERTIVNGQ